MSMGVLTVETIGRVTWEKVVFGTKAAPFDHPKGYLFALLYTLPAAPKEPQNMQALVSTRCGTIRAKNRGQRACAAKRGFKWLRSTGKGTWRSRWLSTRKPRTYGTSHWIVRRSTAPTSGHN